jgi:hypothetical protein
MHRMGHETMRAALIYQHATGERDREIADALQFRIERELLWLAIGTYVWVVKTLKRRR